MKRIFTGIMFLCILLLTGCGTGYFNAGAITTQDFDVADFHSLDISFPFEIIWQESNHSSVSVEMGENLLNRLNVEVRQGVLILSDSRNISFNINNNNLPTLHITSPSLQSIDISSVANISGWDTVISNDFRLNVSGAASIDLDLNLNDFNATFSGASSATFSGQANNANITSIGAASISAFGLELVNANVTLSGAGSIEINASNELDVRLSGVGSVTYMGNPQITRSVTGIGTIRRVN